MKITRKIIKSVNEETYLDFIKNNPSIPDEYEYDIFMMRYNKKKNVHAILALALDMLSAQDMWELRDKSLKEQRKELKKWEKVPYHLDLLLVHYGEYEKKIARKYVDYILKEQENGK